MTVSLLRAMLMAGRVEVKTVERASVVRALMMSVDAQAAEDLQPIESRSLWSYKMKTTIDNVETVRGASSETQETRHCAARSRARAVRGGSCAHETGESMDCWRGFRERITRQMGRQIVPVCCAKQARSRRRRQTDSGQAARIQHSSSA